MSRPDKVLKTAEAGFFQAGRPPNSDSERTASKQCEYITHSTLRNKSRLAQLTAKD